MPPLLLKILTSFFTNDLKLPNKDVTLEDFYNEYVSDFGKQIEGQAKEKYIPAYFGVIPKKTMVRKWFFSGEHLRKVILKAFLYKYEDYIYLLN